MRVGIVGGGLAGALLAWRLAQQPAVAEIWLATGTPAAADATAASGGAVRGYEVNPDQRELAVTSLAELVADPLLRDWSGYVECGSVFLPAEPVGLEPAVEQVNDTLPDSAALVSATELTRDGWAGLTGDEVGVVERQAGYLDPDRFRRSVLTDLARRRGVAVLPTGPVSALEPGGMTLAGKQYRCDVLVLATGAWTPSLLTGNGFPAGGLTTKSIQYTRYRATGMPSTTFVHDSSGLFGKPAPGGLLLGLPTTGWGAPPTGVPADTALADRAAALAGRMFPALRLHSAEPSVAAVDCYADSGLLELRAVPDADDRLFTFTGGTGSAAKTALAASRRAAAELADLTVPAAT